MQDIYVFWDNSNIFHSAKPIAAEREGQTAYHAVRIDFKNIWKLALANRSVKKAVTVGSVPPEFDAVWAQMEAETGVKPELFQRGADTGTEQGIDQCLQTHMLRLGYDIEEPQVIVLLTGDGAGAMDGVGFYKDLQRLHEKGWGIELVAWENSCNRRFKEWAKTAGQFIRLEDYYDSVTYLSGTRDAKALSLTRRAKASPDTTKSETALLKKAEEERQKLEKEVAELRESSAKELRQKKYGAKVTRRLQKK